MPKSKAAPPPPAPTQPHLTNPISFWVEGKPEPAGSKRAIPVFNRHTRKYVHAIDGRPIVAVVDDNPKTKSWQKIIAARANKVYWEDPVTCPVVVHFRFTLQRPLNHLGTGRNAGQVKTSAPACHIIRPDALKLARAVEDALTGVLWNDDAQIVEEHIEKAYGEIEGVIIKVWEFKPGPRSLFDLIL